MAHLNSRKHRKSHKKGVKARITRVRRGGNKCAYCGTEFTPTTLNKVRCPSCEIKFWRK